MRKILRLKKEAMEACNFRGHKMGKWENSTYGAGYMRPRYTASADCERCGASVIVDTMPPANGIETHGDAVAVHCPDDSEEEAKACMKHCCEMFNL